MSKNIQVIYNIISPDTSAPFCASYDGDAFCYAEHTDGYFITRNGKEVAHIPARQVLGIGVVGEE